ncbi:hypothetical protein QO009_004101 [Brevibacillus aydinogluensis]|uniref:conjugal transfer protein n=1 Tax=Brevibacillus aydinogluensis TaxID=927786 RepID=UPI002893006F|nr:conjugal transfer protein [Brevibacillus aydinogluensis]MDT3418176.1 hypothetical protein [Brevibacillus aydinogluensis]
MRVFRKAVNIGLWVLLFFGALGGIGTFMKLMGPDTPKEKDYTAAQSLAEQVARVYVSYNGESLSERQKELETVHLEVDANQLKNELLPPKNITQIVEQVKALKPKEGLDSRLIIPVDTWVQVKKDKEVFKRHLIVEVTIFRGADGMVAVDGVPRIGPADNLAKVEATSGTVISDQDSKLVEPVIKAFLTDYYGAIDPVTLQNSLVDGLKVQPLGGFLQFRNISEMTIKTRPESPDQMDADITVEAYDPVLQTTVYTRVKMSLVKKEGKFYISRVE